jgi:hypothetical protein
MAPRDGRTFVSVEEKGDRAAGKAAAVEPLEQENSGAGASLDHIEQPIAIVIASGATRSRAAEGLVGSRLLRRATRSSQ